VTRDTGPRCYFCSLLCPIGATRTPADRFLPEYPEREDGLRGLCGRGHTTCELLSHPDRRNQAVLRDAGAERAVPLGDALGELAQRLQFVGNPKRVALLVDGNLPAEDIVAASSFAEHCLEGAPWSVAMPSSDEALLWALGGGLRPPSATELAQADVTVVVGDPFLSHPVIAGPLLTAKLASRNATLTVLDSIPNVTSRFATQWICLPPGLEAWALAEVARELGVEHDALGSLPGDERASELGPVAGELSRLAGALRDAERPVIILAPELTRVGAPVGLAVTARAVAKAAGAGVLALTGCGNARAAVAVASNRGATSLARLLRRLHAGELEILLVLGADPAASVPAAFGPEASDRLQVLAVAESLPTATGEAASVLLPLALASESPGTVIDSFGRSAVAGPLSLPPTGAVTVRGLLSGLAKELGKELPRATTLDEGTLLLPDSPLPGALSVGLRAPARPGEEELWLLGEGSAVHYAAGTLTRFAGWARVMEPGPRVAMSPGTAERLGWETGDELDLGGADEGTPPQCLLREDLDEGMVVVSGNFPAARKLFGWPVPDAGDLLPSGPVAVPVQALSRRKAESTQG